MQETEAHDKVLRVKISNDIYKGLLEGSTASGVAVGDIIYVIAEKWLKKEAIKPFIHPENSTKVRQIRFTESQLERIISWAKSFDVNPAIFLHSVIRKNTSGIQK